ncbi:MAG TPA: hypothetical protein VLK29_05615 [Luteimonas sp.]|nr:hypothetical protein [Luteimonas sp.]
MTAIHGGSARKEQCMNTMAPTIDLLESAIRDGNATATTMSRAKLDVATGDMAAMESDCCGSNNYPTDPN